MMTRMDLLNKGYEIISRYSPVLDYEVHTVFYFPPNLKRAAFDLKKIAGPFRTHQEAIEAAIAHWTIKKMKEPPKQILVGWGKSV